MKQKSFILSAYLFFTAAAAPVVAAQQPTLTMAEAIDEAIRNNLGILAERANLNIAESERITAALRPNPVFSFASEGIRKANGAAPAEIALRIDIPIERGPKRELRLATADYAREAAELRLLDAIRRVRLDVTLACIDLIVAKATLALARENLKVFEDLVGTNTVRVNAGAIPPLELKRSEVAKLQFRATVSRAELRLVTARTKLQNLLGRRTLSDLFDISNDLKPLLHTSDLELVSLQESARASRPDIRVLEVMQARSQSELRLQLAQGRVDYTVGAEYRREQDNKGVPFNNTLGLFFSIPIPVSNRNQGEIARVQAEQEQIRRQLEALRAQVGSEVKTAHEEFYSARNVLQSIERDLLRPAQEVRDTSAYVYQSGAALLIEFLDAQRAFNETMQAYYEAQGTYLRALYQLNATVGKEIIAD